MKAERGNFPTESDKFVRFEHRPNVKAAVKKLKKIHPNLAIHFSFVIHGTLKQAEPFAEKIQNCDVYIPEGLDANEDHFEVINDFSEGRLPKKKIKEIETNEFYRGVLFAVHRKRKPVIFIDQPEGHPDIDKWYTHVGREYEAAGRSFSLNRAIKITQQQHSSRILDKRDEFIIEQLPLKLKRVLGENPSLKEKEQLNVFISIGVLHTRLYHALKQELPRTTRDFPEKPFVFDYDDEAGRNILFGKEVDEELARATILENNPHIFLTRAQRKLSYSKRNILMRGLISKLYED
jgi:hypothetical protein